MVEAVEKDQPLVEVCLGFGVLRGDRMVVVAEARVKLNRFCGCISMLVLSRCGGNT
ncbi:MAG: hypothetical protein ACREX9_22425 [Gammaproteobacteria bacterium]